MSISAHKIINEFCTYVLMHMTIKIWRMWKKTVFWSILSIFTSCKKESRFVIGADFHRAVVASVPGEQLLIGNRPMRNWISATKINKNCSHQSCSLTAVCIKSFFGWGTLLGELTAYRKGKGGRKGDGGKAGRKKRRRAFVFCAKKKKKTRRVCFVLTLSRYVTQRIMFFYRNTFCVFVLTFITPVKGNKANWRVSKVWWGG